MFLNYFKIAFQNYKKQKIYSAINLIGLAVGITSSFLIILYVLDELSYDKFNTNHERIFRVLRGDELDSEATPSIIATLFKREFPEVAETGRIHDYTRFGPVVIHYEDKKFQENKFLYADSSITRILSFDFIYGNPNAALNRPNTVLLNKKTSEKYFGKINPVGKTISLNNSINFEITGVIKNIPDNSHIKFDFLASLNTRSGWSELSDTEWRSANFYTYVLLKDENFKISVESRFPGLIERELGEQLKASGDTYRLGLIALTDLHLRFHGNITYVYLFSGIALLILLIACINYMNLATARAMGRAREVGMRKVLGAFRKQLIGQFYGESFFISFFAICLSIFLTSIALPYFNKISGKEIVVNYWENPLFIAMFMLLGVIVGLFSGSYPALMLSSFLPSKVLKGVFKTSSTGRSLRKGLVVFQFLVSVFLIIATAGILNQLEYMQNKKLGYNKDHIIILPIGDKVLKEKYTLLKNELLQNSNIKSASGISSYPGYMLGGYSVSAEGLPQNETYTTNGVAADKETLETLDIKLISGSNFPLTIQTPEDGSFYFIINEELVRSLGWTNEEAVGKRFDLHGREGIVSGVMKNFNFESLHKPIGPLTFFYQPQNFQYLLVKLNTDDIKNSLSFIEDKWNRIAPHRPFEYLFLDKEYDALYRTEKRAGEIFSSFSSLAVLIACLGLLGLASYAAEQKKKEIGIRKVLGANALSIVVLLSKEFTKLVVIAALAAIPFSYFAVEKWLENFAFRISMGYDVIVFAVVLTLLIALLTVSYQTIKVSRLNPAKVLKDE